ncbi:HicB family protein [Mycobacterium marinum]|nr:HicB family protein [Mycobacterium marinum]
MNELHYTYRVEWSPEDEEWVGLVAEFPSLSWLDPDLVEAMRGIRDLVAEVVADMRVEGETPPAPLADRRYSGKVFVRTSPELHRRLTIEAAEQGVSVNQWAMQKLAERPGAARFGVDFPTALHETEWPVTAECYVCGVGRQLLPLPDLMRQMGALPQTGDVTVIPISPVLLSGLAIAPTFHSSGAECAAPEDALQHEDSAQEACST